jgi:hypothetical protein
MRTSIFLGAIALLAASVAGAQQTTVPDPLLDHMIGRWILRGRIAGRATTHDVTCQWVLGHEYVEMREVSRERTGTGSPTYEAIVYVGRDPRSREYAVMWLDNTAYGAFAPAGVGHAQAAGDSIPFLFRYSDTDLFHTTFVYDRTHDAWQWHMDNDKSGTRAPFARVTLSRR